MDPGVIAEPKFVSACGRWGHEIRQRPLCDENLPDGTRVIVRWSEIGQQVDNGEKFGGAPRIVAYDPAKDGVVPIGQPNQRTETVSTNPTVPSATSVVSPDQPAKMDYTNADPKDYEDAFGTREGFAFRTAVGVAYQQPLSGRSGDGALTRKWFFNLESVMTLKLSIM